MKLQVTQENLAKALNTVARVANTKSTLPILSNVILKTVGNRLIIAATNLEIAITHFVGAKVSKEGATTVPGRLMQDFVSSLPSGVINLSQEDNKLKISMEKYKSVVNGASADDFPVMPAIKKPNKWTIGANELKEGLQQVVVAASSDEARQILTGVYLHNLDGKLFVAATDSYRLAEKELAGVSSELKLLIPASAISDLLRIVNDYEDNVEVNYDEQQVLFKAGDIELVTRLIDGNYPDYKKLIPTKFETSIKLKRADLINITKVSSLFARESAGSITISASEADKQVSIKAVASQLGENTASADAQVRGEGEITLNSRYLLDGLNAINSQEVTFGFNGKLEPSVLKPADAKDYIHIIMPLKS